MLRVTLEAKERPFREILDHVKQLNLRRRGSQPLILKPQAQSILRARWKTRPACRRHAVRIAASASRRSSAIAISRMRNFWIFPVTVIGKTSTNFQ